MKKRFLAACLAALLLLGTAPRGLAAGGQQTVYLPVSRTVTWVSDTLEAPDGLLGELGTTTYAYDSAGNLTTETVRPEDGGYTQTISCAYDSDGRLLERTLVNTYDGGGSDRATTTYDYDGQGRLVREASADLLVTYVYTGTAKQPAEKTEGEPPYDTTTHYTYDDNGNVIRESDGFWVTDRTYDSQGRLTLRRTVSSSDENRWNWTSYTYDGHGNVTRSIYTEQYFDGMTGAYDTMETVTTYQLQYDTAGNLIRQDQYEDGTLTLRTTWTYTALTVRTACEKHTYSSAGGDYCTVCGEKFEPVFHELVHTAYARKDQTPIRSNYYSQNSEVVRRVAQYTPLQATGYLVNAVGRTWIALEDGTYVYSENVTPLKPDDVTLRFSAGSGLPAGTAVTALPAGGTMTAGSYYTIPTELPSADGYLFLGYAETATAASPQYLPGQTLQVTENLTLYALWEERTNTYVEDMTALISDILQGTSSLSHIGDNGSRYWSWWYNYDSGRLDSWCAVYVSYLMAAVGAEPFAHGDQINPNSQAAALDAAGCYRPAGDYVPKTGDLVFYEYGGQSWNGRRGASGNLDHVAMVVVEEDGSVHYLHGNIRHSDGQYDRSVGRVWYFDDTITTGGVPFTSYIAGYGDIEAWMDLTAE